MYCFVIFQKGLRNVFNESSHTACNTFQHLLLYFNQFTQNLNKLFSGRNTLSTGENPMKIRAVVFEFIARRQTDTAEDFVL